MGDEKMHLTWKVATVVILTVLIVSVSGCIMRNNLEKHIKTGEKSSSEAPFILAASSEDGIHFSESEKVIQGSVPEVLKVNGKFLMYYVIPGEDEIRIAESEDGIHFHNSQVVIEKGDEYDKFGAVDPAVIQISENLFRMYYVGWEEDIPGGWGRNSLLTAISTDGIHWKKERKILSKEKLSDVAVIRIENGFRIYYSDKDNLYAFDSADGVNITKDWGRIMERVSVPFVLKTDNEYRLYYTKVPDSPEEGIDVYLSTSKDGINFTGEKLILENADAPCVIKVNEKFVIYYHIPPPPPPEASGEEKSVLRSMPQGTATLSDRFGFVCFDPLAISDLNLGWLRPHPGPFIWDKIEPERGKYDFSEADEVVREAQAMGLNILATIWPYAKWDQEKWGNIDRFVEKRDFPELPFSRYKPYNMQAYKEFVKALVERYDGDGFNDMPGLTKPIKYWEVINEPSTGIICKFEGKNAGFFKGDAEDYFEVLKVTYEAIKEADKDAKVLNGGMVPLPPEKGEVSDGFYGFWNKVFEMGGSKYIDIVNFHSFSPYEDAIRLKERFGKYVAGKPLWVTEFSATDEYRYVEASKSFGEGVERIFYTAYRAFPEAPEDLITGSLIDFEGNPKRSYYAVKTMNIIIGNFDEVEKLSDALYKFKVNDMIVYVVWSSDQEILEGFEGKLLVVDITAHANLIEAEKLKLGSLPVYIVSGDEKKLKELLSLLEDVERLPPQDMGDDIKKNPVEIPEAFAFRFGGWGHKHDEYAYTPGYRWMKPHPGPFNRYFIEKEKGVYDFSACDEGVKRAQQTGAEIVATIWPYTEWDEEAYKGREGYGEATGGGPFAYVLPSSRFKPYDIQAYKAFVRALVERYDGDGIDDMPGLKYPIKYWEILNEPEAQHDNKYFFKGSGKEYFELVKATYEAVKEADSTAKVVLGGAATLDKESIEWWEEFYSLGGGNYFDIAGIHSYADEKDDFNVDDLKKLLEKYGINKPIWVTEVGPTGEMSREDGIMFAKAAIRAFANGAEVLFFDYKPVAHVMAYIIGDFNRVEKSSEGVYVFETKEDKVYVVWKPGKFPIEGSEIYVADIYGNVRVEDASGIEVGDTPIYLFKSEKILQRLKMFMKAQGEEKNY
ncbi:glycosyl hydrolase [Archaeoglobus sulfaticallidus]|nr:glycosyl hydrolase [Archaeoglobus sulfaticallidus]